MATDSFAYTVTDPTGATATATVTVTVEGVNDAPVIEAATAGLAVVAEGSVATVAGLYSDADLGDTHQVTIDGGVMGRRRRPRRSPRAVSISPAAMSTATMGPTRSPSRSPTTTVPAPPTR